LQRSHASEPQHRRSLSRIARSEFAARLLSQRSDSGKRLTISGTVRLNFAFSWNFSPFQGLVINLDTQQILNDGYGNSEILNLTDAGGWLQLEATENADSIVGSDLDEAFILRGGNDTLDGGGGFDLLRFDRNQMASGVNVDLQTGIATGAWNSGGSTKGFTQRVTGIEEIRGTNAFSDTIRGSAAEEWIEGRGGNDVIDGRGGNDTLIGQDGNDSLLGSAGDDELFGDNGNDTLIGGLGNDYLDGGNGNDRLDASADATGFGDFVRPGLGTNTIIGSSALFNTFGDGIDISYSDLSGIGGLTIRISASGAGTTRSGQIGKVNDTFTFAHYFIGSQDADLIVGANEATGDANAFRFEGYSGQAGNDTIIGGTGGFDRLSYRNDEDDNENTLAVQVNFATGKAIDTYGDTDTFSGIEAVEGTSLGDEFTGSAAIEYLQYSGFAGADTINGSSDGYDDLEYNNDVWQGGGSGILADLNANQVVDGFGDVDTVYNIDGIRGTQFDDAMTAAGTSRAVRFIGNDGNDTLIGGAGSDELIAGFGDDFINPGDNTDFDFIQAGAGQDTISFADVVEGFVDVKHDDLNAGIAVVVNGSANTGSINKGVNGTTTLIDVSNPISSGAGPFGGLGIVGTDFNDTFTITNSLEGYIQLQGGRGNDRFTSIGELNGVRLRYDLWDVANGIRMNLATGVVSNDGFGFVDTISGPARFDEIQATRFADVIVGSAVGTETYILQGGNDTLTGGGGYDVVRYDRGDSVGPVNVDLAAQTARGTWNGVAFTNRLVDIDEVRGSSMGNDTLLGDGLANLIQGRGGNDILDGRGGNDTLEGEAGNDRITGGAGADTLLGGEGNDLFVISTLADHAAGEIIVGDAGTDELRYTGAVAGTLVLGAGVDVERVVIGTGTAAAAVVTGTTAISVNASALEQAVTLVGNAGANRLTGSGFGDTLEGGAGNDTLAGGAGDDALVGGAGNDVLTGGAGADEFVFRSRTSGVDTITDFNLDGGEDEGDLLVFEGLGVGTFAYLGAGAFTGGSDNSEARVLGSQVLVDTNGDGTADITITLAGLTNANQLAVDDFLFV
jgi:Ca2+-binding RTX toxin-like protein